MNGKNGKHKCVCDGVATTKCRYPHNGIQTNSSKKRGQILTTLK